MKPAVRPNVALINNSQTPYRQALHSRIVREIPEAKFFSVFTHEVSNAAWAFRASSEINPVEFGRGEKSQDAGRLTSVLAEWRKGARIIQWIYENKISAVVLGGYNDTGRLRIIQFCQRNNIPCFLFGDSNIKADNATGIKGVFKRIMLRHIVRSCSAVMPCGELGRQYFLKYGADVRHVYLFPYEPDYRLIESLSEEALAKVCTEFGLSPHKKRIVYSGRLISLKRVDLLIEAFVSIANVRPDWDLIIVGDGPLRSELERQVPSCILERVRWLGFLDDQMTLSALYRLSDVLVLPSDYEPWGVVVNEAIAAGMALITSDQVGAAHELVEHGTNGFVFAAGNSQQLVEQLVSVTEPVQLAKFKANAKLVLGRWKDRGDPVSGLRRALVDFNVIEKQHTQIQQSANI